MELPLKPRTLIRSRIVVGLAASALLMSGCASSSDSDKKSGSDAPKSETTLVSGMVNLPEAGDPVEGGVLTVAEYSEARSLDPTKTYGNGAAGGSAMAAIYDTLTRYDWGTETYVPQLAESLTSDDNTTWTLKLREGVKFSDGTALDADAVLASLDYYTKSYGYNFVIWMSNVAETKKVDDTTVEFTTRFPWATFPSMLSHGPGMILAPAAYKNAAKDPASFKPIGAGPFVFDGYKPTEELTLSANEDYFDGRPHLDGLKFIWPGADSAKLEALDNGDVDAAFLREPKVTADALDAKKAGMLWVTGAGSAYWINHREGHPGANPKVREALNLAIDPARYYERVGNTDAVASKSLFPANSPWFTGVETVTPDPAAAKKLVEEAKKEGWDGTIRYSHLSDAASQQAAVALKAMLEAAGFKVVLEPMKSIADQIQKLYVDHSFDLAASAVTVGEDDPYTMLAGVLTPQSPTNTSGYQNEEMLAALTKLAGSSGPTDGAEAMKEIETIWQRDLPAINMADGTFMQTWTNDVHGITGNVQMLIHYDDAWLTK